MESRCSVWKRVALAAWLLVAAGCESSTGVLIEVTRDDTVPARLGRLVFHVGVDGVASGASRFVDPDPEADVRLEGRDVAADPYRLLIRPSQHPDARVMVGVVGYAGGEVVGFGALAEAVRFVDGEVTLWRIVLQGQMPDGFAVTDTECVTWLDGSGARVTIGQPGDQDCDGWGEEDCNDLEPRIHPGASETCDNAVDDDCDGETDENVDEDHDLVTTCDGDCNDGDNAIHPGAAEECDGMDNNCNGQCDEGLDRDGDYYTACGSRIVEGGARCLFNPARADCDDYDETIHPGAPEACDGVDNDCNQVCDDSSAGLDRDGDGFTPCGSLTDHCGRSRFLEDCQDDDPEIHPGAPELCNGKDDDCDGHLLGSGPAASDPCFVDVMGSCVHGERECAEQEGDPGEWLACQPGGGPFDEAPQEACDAFDLCVDDPDLYTCLLHSPVEFPIPTTSCGVTYQIAGGVPCTKAVVELPIPAGGNCSWRVVGGVDQIDYRVGLRASTDPNGAPQPSLGVGVCEAFLVVETISEDPPSPILVLLARTPADSTDPADYFPISLAPRLVEECDPAGGLECEDFPDAP